MKDTTKPLVKATGLTKRYPSFTLQDVSLEVSAGSITGFIGRNGAGKSTTLKCLEGSLHPDAGEVAYFGRPFAGNEEAAKRQVGFELGGVDFYRTKRLSEIAQVTRRFYEAPQRHAFDEQGRERVTAHLSEERSRPPVCTWDQQAYEHYCQLFDLDQRKRVKDLSQGMRVKFSLALALSHRSRLLILDEPTSGLDPASREEVLDIFLDLARRQEVGILFSTHITSDLDKCADHIIYIDDGRIVGAGEISAFKARYRVAPLEVAQRAKAPIIGTRRSVSGDTALVPAQAGIGTPATLDDIMTHTHKFDHAAASAIPDNHTDADSTHAPKEAI